MAAAKASAKDIRRLARRRSGSRSWAGTASVRREIVERLGMEDPAVFVRGFDRPNLHLGAHCFSEEHEPPCGNCDAGLVEREADVERPFRGRHRRHPQRVGHKVKSSATKPTA